MSLATFKNSLVKSSGGVAGAAFEGVSFGFLGVFASDFDGVLVVVDGLEGDFLVAPFRAVVPSVEADDGALRVSVFCFVVIVVRVCGFLGFSFAFAGCLCFNGVAFVEDASGCRFAFDSAPVGRGAAFFVPADLDTPLSAPASCFPVFFRSFLLLGRRFAGGRTCGRLSLGRSRFFHLWSLICRPGCAAGDLTFDL